MSADSTSPAQAAAAANHGTPAETAWRIRLEFVIGVLALTQIVLFLVTSLSRLRYPFPLEQLEGPMLLAAERLAHGLPIYVRPNFTFIPYMYAPAYYYISGWAVRILGPNFVALRLISIVSTCASFILIYIVVLSEAPGTQKRRHLAALAGAGLYAAAYPWTREWFDLGRVDSLYVFLLLLALFCTRRLHPTLAAVAWTLAFLAKQTILPVALIMLCCNWNRPRRLLVGVGSFLLMIAVSTRLLNHATHGWYWFYAFTVPHANADLVMRPAVFFLPAEVIAPFGLALLVIAVAWASTRLTRLNSREQSSARRFYFLAGVSIFALCWFLQAHAGATSNTPMPAYAVLAILFGIAFGWLDFLFAWESWGGPARIILLAAVGIPFLSWMYSPHDVIPHRGVMNSQEELVTWLRQFPGDVFAPSDPFEAVKAGKLWHPDVAALHDSLRPDNPQIRQPLLAEIRAEIDQEKFDVIVLDGTPAAALANETWLPSDLQTQYPLLGLIPGGDVANPFTPHPIYFLLPCREQGLAVTKGWILLRSGGNIPCSG